MPPLRWTAWGEILMMNRLASEYLKLDQLNAVAFFCG